METSEKHSKILAIVKKVIVWLMISCAALIIASGILSYLYRDTITNFVTQELLNQVNGEVTVEKIDVSFLQSFPNVSIQLHSVLAKSTDSFNRKQFAHKCDTALYAKKLSLGFNIFDFFKQHYIVRNIQLHSARVFYVADKQGNHNWNFLKASSDSSTKQYFIDLSKISLFESSITVHLLPQQLYTQQQAEELFVEGDFFSDTIRCAVEGDMHSNFVELNNAVYARNYDILLKTDIAIDDKTIAIENIKAKLPFFNCTASAKITTNNTRKHIDAKYTLHIPSLFKLFGELPDDIRSNILQYVIDGKVDVQGWCKGNITAKSLPALGATISCEKGSMSVKDEPITFSLKTTVKTSDLGDISRYQLGKTTFNATLKNSTASGTFTIDNLKDVTADLQAQTTLNIADIKPFIPNNYALEGVLKGSVNYKGSLLDFSNITPNFFEKNTFSAHLQAEDITFIESEQSPLAFSQINGTFDVQNASIQIDSTNGIVQNNSFFINGAAHNLLPYLLCENQQASFTGIVQLGELNLNPFIDYSNAQPTTNSKSEFAANIALTAHNVQYDNIQLHDLHTNLNYKKDILQLLDFSAQSVQYDKAKCTDVHAELMYNNGTLQLPVFNAKTAQYDNYLLKDVQSKVVYDNNSLQLLNTRCTFLNGTYEGHTQLTFNPDATTHCKAEGNLRNMPIREVMTTFNSFDQTFVQAEQINGIVTADFTLKMKLNKDNSVEYSGLQLQSKINIQNGEISNFEPFIAMGKKLKVEEFKNVTFNQIENTLTITNDTVHIPYMDIRTNAFELKFSGTHTISSNQFKYFMTVYLKKTLTQMFQKRNKTEDFGEIEHNTDGNIAVPLKLVGTPDKFNIDYDFKTSLTNVKQGIEQQKNEWRTILNGGKEPEIPENSSTNTTNSTQTNQSTTQPTQKPKSTSTIQSGFEIEYD
ncbi:MAG: AsmA-like C-terminal region-containing protein [Bacteroidales bacterium]|jgi:hypothetical protein|nr:AsmA-like C-terminal region-containing protein [Bacteroidales bacterium]